MEKPVNSIFLPQSDENMEKLVTSVLTLAVATRMAKGLNKLEAIDNVSDIYRSILAACSPPKE